MMLDRDLQKHCLVLAEDVIHTFDSDAEFGLTNAAVNASFAKFGHNKLEEGEKVSFYH